MSDNQETIFALSTIEGRSGICVFRISGQHALDCLRHLGVNKELEPRVASLVNIMDPDSSATLDRCIAIYFKAPASFTGEDVVELHLHGSRAIISEIASILSAYENCRHASPGEFSMRAFENDKMDLTELEGLADLIDAETKLQQRQAMRQMSGELEKLYEEWRALIIASLARVEAYIDFPDEDLPQELQDEIISTATQLVDSINEHLSDRRGEVIRDGVNCVILGPPNAGKSSLINYLAKRDVAIVSDIAGTTRDAIEVHLDIAGYPVTIVDTAGLRDNPDTIEEQGIKRALSKSDNADLRIVMLDAQSALDDTKSIELIDSNTIVLINKADLSEFSVDSLENTKALKIISTSLKDGSGLDEFIDSLELVLKDKFSFGTSPTFTRQRHREGLLEATKSLESFCESIKTQPIELASEELRHAAQAIGRITGKIDVEELLGEIFSSFCIGK